jgi:hypothetical protein
MRDGWKRRWGWRVSAIVLMGGVLGLVTDTVVTQAGERDDDHNQRNPFQQILHKLDKILDAIKGEGGARWKSHVAVGSEPAGGAAVCGLGGVQQRGGA